MAMLAPVAETIKRGRGRPGNDEINPWDFFNNQGFRVTGNMSKQAFDLEKVRDLNGMEDRMRADMASIQRAESKNYTGMQVAYRLVASRCKALAEACEAAGLVFDDTALRAPLMDLGRTIAAGAEFNRQEQIALGHVDVLDALQGLDDGTDADAVIQRCQRLNRDTRQAGLEIIAASEPTKRSVRPRTQSTVVA